MKIGTGKIFLAAVLVVALSLLVSPILKAAPFNPGDVFVSLHNGQIQWRSADGSLVTTISGSPGMAEGMAFDAAGNLYVTHFFRPDLTAGNSIDKFSTSGTLLGTFGSDYNCNPKSLVFSSAGHAFVGQADCGRAILQFDSSGTFINSFNAAVEGRGTDWLSLAPDQCTIFYTSQGTNIKRYNVCTPVGQLADFNAAALPEAAPPVGQGAHAVQILPDGGVLVADCSSIVRLQASGARAATPSYDADAGLPKCFLGLALTPDGTAFWTTN
jgi:hypothetical protein